ncbi:MAG: peptidoglycan-binding domain-containing protein [Acetobacteraceae bacterium]|nr:peptidoglycan-binding domain-containing protein [Acetobacteraceae bacterium]
MFRLISGLLAGAAGRLAIGAAGRLATGAALMLAGATPAGAQAPAAPTALIISNSGYTGLPKLPVCQLSANLVSAVLTRAGFKVSRQSDASNARLSTAIATLGDEAAAVPGSRTLIYICSYATTFGDRTFILPAEVRLDRDADVLSQGIIARLLMSSVAGPGSAAGLVLMDVAPPPGRSPLTFTSMLRPSDAAHGGLIAAGLPTASSAGAAPLAAALSEAMGAGPLEIGGLLATLAAQPATKQSLLTLRPPTEPSWLIGGPAPAATAEIDPTPARPAAPPAESPPAPPPPAPATVAAAPPPPVAPVAAPASAPSASAPATAPAADTALADPNPADRRRLQLALSRLGYYRGRIDGTFAAETATAIRQFQRESNAEPTGKLTVRQMEELLR